MKTRHLCLALLLLPAWAHAASRCDLLLQGIGQHLADASCVQSTDLTTANPATTPANNSIATLPFGAFTPITDRGVIAPSAAKRPPIAAAVPGVQLQGRFASDPTGQARFLLRLPDNWNGRLVVAGASGTRSEFNGDFAWSDYLLQKGYAYASQNKGVLNLRIASLSSPTPPNALACRLNPASNVWVNFYDNDDGQPFTRWTDTMLAAARLAQRGVHAAYGRPARYTYAVGTSNGGYQVRRALESADNPFDGGVDWEGTFVDPAAPNLLTDLPAGVRDFADYAASGNSASSTAAANLLAAGYAPDIVASPTASLWTNYWASFWEVTQCQWQKRLDPGYDTYGSGTGSYNYYQRLSFSDVGAQLAAIATTGHISKPLITVAGTMDSLLPIDHHARAYARKVHAAVGEGEGRGAASYRLYEVQNGNHIETYQDAFPQLELIMPHAQRAFDALVANVELGVALPPDQCIPRGGAIAATPAEPGHCAALFVP